MIKAQIGDGSGSGKKATVAQKDQDVGLVTLTEPLHDQFVTVTPLLNPSFGADLNQNVGFSGTPELIHDGGDNVGWTGAIVAGTWDFADTTNPNDGTKCVSITAADNLDEATFADATETAMSGRTAITGQIRLETYSGVDNSILLQFENNNVDVGNSVNLNDFIDTGLLNAYQGFVIPKDDFGLASQTVDEVDMTVLRTAGSKPTFRFDQFQIEQTGNPETFLYKPENGQTVKLIAIKATMADNVTAESSYNAFLGVSVLANGIVVSAQSLGRNVFAGTFTRLIDFLGVANSTYETSVGAADTWLSVNIPFNDNQVILKDANLDSITFTVNDDLSGLLFFRVFVTVTENV